MSANCSGNNYINGFNEKPSTPTTLLVDKFATIVIIACFVHCCKNIVEVLGEGIVSVTDTGSDRDDIFYLNQGLH